MIRSTFDDHMLFKFHLLSESKDVVHFITARQGGASKPPYESFNLSLNVGDKVEDVLLNRSKLAFLAGISKERIYFPDQRHTANIKEVTIGTLPEELLNTDALVSNTKDCCITVLTADCVPVLLYDREKHAIAVIHAGWRGTIEMIVTKTIRFMEENYKSKASDLMACLGPSISWQNYEVGDEVSGLFRSKFGSNSKVIKFIACSNKAHIDLCKANRLLLVESGVLTQNIEVSRLCTFDKPGLFFSARRDGIESGRIATCIMLK